ncbi:MAG TPA: FAD-dependent monooxygenase [Gemmatimonadaceae bacterium]|nr:FAD-dependent monooxygenase [Gemmatimonadaceae bacterium]
MAKILVVGAGPTGLTMAAVLARYGHVPRVIDKEVEPPADRSRAIVIQARTLELFDDLGIVREILDAALVVDSVNVITPDGWRGTLLIRREWIDSVYGGLVTLPQDETERILGELVARGGIEVERGVELVGLDDGAEYATAVLRHPDGREERASADYVLGCDGSHSGVRQLAGIPFPGHMFPDDGLIGDVEMRWPLPERVVSGCPGTDGLLLAFPLPGVHHFRVIMVLPSSQQSESRDLAPEEFLAQLRRLVPQGKGEDPPAMIASRWLTRYRLHSRGAPCYRKGRAFVAGDAAHIHSPVGAQGMNTGIQDAYNLGWKLGLVAHGVAPEWVLDTYHVERHPVGARLLRVTDRMFAVLAGGGRMGRTLRRVIPALGVRIIGWPVVGRRIARFVSQTGIRYRVSPLTTEGHGAARLPRHAPHAGDRAPDAELGPGRRISDLLRGPQHTLLLFGNRSTALIERFSELAAEVSARYGALVRPVLLRLPNAQPPRGEVDARGAAHDRYGAEAGAIYLVRPDGHIAFRGAETDTEPLRATLKARFLLPDSPRR